MNFSFFLNFYPKQLLFQFLTLFLYILKIKKNQNQNLLLMLTCEPLKKIKEKGNKIEKMIG